MDRNPSPPSSEAEEEEEGDAVGSTVYSKHWLFSILTRLIEVRRGAGGRPGRRWRSFFLGRSAGRLVGVRGGLSSPTVPFLLFLSGH